MSDWHEAARVLRASNPGMSHGEIGRLLGVGRSAVWKVLNPESSQEIRRRDNGKRRVAKLEHDRRQRAAGVYAKACDNPVCGERCGVTSRSIGTIYCRDCIHATAVVRQSLAEGMWADDWTLREMGEAFDVSRAYFMVRRKEDGWDLPYRRSQQVVANIRAGTIRGLRERAA